MTIRFSPKVVDALLEKLSGDDEFRSLFQKDPREALRQVGHETPQESINVAGADPVMCCSPATLASKEQIKAGYAQLRQQVLAFNPFMYFEAGSEES